VTTLNHAVREKKEKKKGGTLSSVRGLDEGGKKTHHPIGARKGGGEPVYPAKWVSITRWKEKGKRGESLTWNFSSVVGEEKKKKKRKGDGVEVQTKLHSPGGGKFDGSSKEAAASSTGGSKKRSSF